MAIKLKTMPFLFLILILSIYSCTIPASTGQNTLRPERNLTGFTLQPQSACPGEYIEIQGAHYTPQSPLFLIFQTEFNPNNTSPAHADTLLIQELETDAEGYIQTRFQVPAEVQRQPEGASEALPDASYTALLVNTYGNFHNRIDFEVRDCSPSVPTGGIPTPAPGSSIGWPEDLEPGQPHLQALPESVCQGEPIHLRAFQFTPGDWVGLSMQAQDQVFSLNEQLQIDGATQTRFFLESDSYSPGDYTVTLRSHALNMQAEAKITIREACDA